MTGPIPPTLIFLAFALLCLPYPGLQQDETLFAWPLCRPAVAAYNVDIGGHPLPLMLMSYLGALKTWLYAPLLAFWTPSVYSLRLPAVLLAALTVYLLHILLTRLHSRAAASIAALLLATDSIYILSSTFDWGPVVVQHLLLVSFLLCIERCVTCRRQVFLFLACVLVGLAFWDKAVVVWMAAGLGAATLAVYAGALRSYLTMRNAALAAAAFCLGALPLLAFNASRSFATLTSNSNWEPRGPLEKYPALLQSLNGTAFFGSLVNPEWQARATEPASAIESVVEGIDHAGIRSSYSALPLVIVLALLCLAHPGGKPVRRLAHFLTIAFAVAWWFMTSIRTAGGSAHHIVLLWPLPHMLAGIALAQAASSGGWLRRVVLALVPLAIAVNAANSNHYAAELMRHGAAWQWTDATSRLPDVVRAAHAVRIGVDDWGIAGPLDVVTSGQLVMSDAADLGFRNSAKPGEPVLRQVKDTLWLGWTPEYAVQPEAKRAMEAFAAAQGLTKSVDFVVRNRNGTAMLEGYRFVAQSAQPVAASQPGGRGILVVDDTEPGIHYQGKWDHGRGFGQALQGTLAYADRPGSSVEFEFEGSAITLVYTKAFNRGVGRIRLDGRPVSELDYYDAAVQWQQRYRIDHLAPGKHKLAVEALGRSQARSSGSFIDVDAFLVEAPAAAHP
ncbi:MAG: hypothetical protein QM757_01690 [Paludibaculum sp.]